MSVKPVTFGESYTADGVTVVADELEISLEPKALGQGPAEAIRVAIATGIKAITVKGKDEHRLFNRTGHLANDMTLKSRGTTWEIAAPSDRLGSATLYDRLSRLVAAIPRPLDQPLVIKAIEKSVKEINKVTKKVRR